MATITMNIGMRYGRKKNKKRSIGNVADLSD